MNELGDLTADQKSSLSLFRALVKDLYVHDDFFLLRFLKARQFNLQKSERMIRKHFEFHQRYGLDTVLDDYVMPALFKEHFSHYIIGCDKEGNGVTAFCSGYTDLKGMTYAASTKEHIQFFIYLLESMKLLMKQENMKNGVKRGWKFVFIFDLDGLNIFPLLDRKVVKLQIDLISMLEDNYPEMLKVVYMINVPGFFPPWFNLFKKTLQSETLKKVKVYGNEGWKEELVNIIDANILPSVLGGNLTDPDGNKMCHTMFKRNKIIPENLKNIHTDFKADPHMTELMVRERSFFNHEVYVSKVGTTIRWSFQTLGYNIGFALYHVPSGVKAMPVMSRTNFSKSFRHRVSRDVKEGHVAMIQLQRVESQLFPEEGKMICKNVGKYLLHFDNTFSWITPKTLYYRVEVIPPENVRNDSKLNAGNYISDFR